MWEYGYVCFLSMLYITSDHDLPEMENEEEAMLSEAFNITDKSRLGCQIPINENMNGLEATIAPEE